MPRNQFQALIGASDVTLDRLTRYEALLIKWQKAINLIGPKTVDDIWVRHFLDSAQFWAHIPTGATTLLDLGSGAGFPGLVLAVLAADPAIGRPGFKTHLVESDQRKATFLREAARMMALPDVTIHAQRIETLAPVAADVVTARACAPLAQLLDWSAPMLKNGALGLFAKGAQAEDEIAGVAGHQIDRMVSASDPSGRLLLVRRLPSPLENPEGRNHDAAA
jgi:16S rRNA (guanine527-N7)-methyltransferase